MVTILAVDDEYIISNLLKEVLTLNKHNVAEASDGKEAPCNIDPMSPPDLILMDQ